MSNPQGWLSVVVEPLRTTKRTHPHIKWYGGRVHPTASGFWRVSRGAMDLRGDFPMRIGSGTGAGGITIGLGVVCVPGPCPVKLKDTVLFSCGAWPTQPTN